MKTTLARPIFSHLVSLHSHFPIRALKLSLSTPRDYSLTRERTSHGLSPGPDRPAHLRILAAAADHHLTLSLHARIIKSGFHADTLIATSLISALSRSADTVGARHLFDGMPDRDIAAWNAMLSCYARNGLPEQVLALFHEMGCTSTRPNSRTLSVLLQACCGVDDKRLGRGVHAYLCKHLELVDTFLQNSLLVYYNRFGDLDASETLFCRMTNRDIVSWNVMMSGYMRGGVVWRVLEVFRLLDGDGLRPDLATLETALQACARIGEGAVEHGEAIHGLLVRYGFHMDVYTGNSLLLMYCKCGKIERGESLFDEMEVRNIVSWNIIVSGCVQFGVAEKALSLLRYMRSVQLEMSSDLFVSALQAVRVIDCCLKQAMRVHCLVIVMGFEFDAYVSSSVIAAYGDCGEVAFARKCLDYAAAERSVMLVSCNAMLSVYVRHGCYSEAVDLIRILKPKACMLDAVTLLNALSICTQTLDLKMGKAVHGYMIRNQFESDVFANTSLLEFYASCGILSAACRLFSRMPIRNIVSWNTMIHSCVHNGFPRASLQLFHLMQQRDGFLPDATSVVGVIEAIAQIGCRIQGDYIHKYVVQEGLADDEFVANSLMAMYAGFHDFDKARLVFNGFNKPSLVMWNTMIAECSYHGQAGNAISVFHQMKVNNMAPDSISLLGILQACVGLSSMHCVMWVHAIACKASLEDVYVGTSLLDAYAKCGELSKARLVFEKMNYKTAVSWNSMIQGYGIHGNAEEAGNLFSQMQESGLNPTAVTFLILMSACSHTGDMQKGQHYFNLMSQTYSFSLDKEHLSCFANLLGRSGLVKEACDSLKRMEKDLGVCTWGALLESCRVQGNLEMGLVVAERLFELDHLHWGYNVLLSNIYAEAGRWIDASRIRSDYDKMGLRKMHGWSMIESFS